MFNAVCTKNSSHRRDPQHRRGKNEIIQKSALNFALWHCRDNLIGLSDPVRWNCPCFFLFANGVKTFSSRLVDCNPRQQEKPSQPSLWLDELMVSTVILLLTPCVVDCSKKVWGSGQVGKAWGTLLQSLFREILRNLWKEILSKRTSRDFRVIWLWKPVCINKKGKLNKAFLLCWGEHMRNISYQTLH